MSNGIILAGGKASRLGPLSTQISKALVSIGQRPHVFHQIELMRAANCVRIIVVANPATHIQVQTALERAGHYDIKVVPQNVSRGPVDAILVGLHALGPERHKHDTYVLMSDTFIEEKLDRHSGTWIGEALTPVGSRSFCVREDDGTYVDKQVRVADSVTIGAYHFADTIELLSEASTVMTRANLNDEHEVGMGPLLSCFPTARTIAFPTWLDIGDVHALAIARRTRFIARSEHTLSLDDAGIITKRGTGEQFAAQRNWLIEQSAMGDRSANLIPRYFGSVLDGGYAMEYVDLPTLSELWLYWPGRPDTWVRILQSVTDRLDHDLWWSIKSYNEVASAVRVASWFAGKALERLTTLDHALATRHFDLLERASEVFTSASMVRAHGDLNFNNILYSINTGTCKLVDPRGTPFMPLIYEIAKLRYSYHAGFSAITHNLFYNDNVLMPDRADEIKAMDEFLEGYFSLEQLQVAEGCLLLAGAPLHSPREREVMISRGVQLIKEIVG